MRNNLFQARHFYWLATKLPWAMYRAGLSVEQMIRVIYELNKELRDTNNFYSEDKFNRVVELTIRKIKKEVVVQ